MWDETHKAVEEVGLRIKQESKAEGYIEFTNGSKITFRGNTNKAEADKGRGYSYRLVIIDECGHQKNMQYLMDEVLRPTMADYADSVLIATGTPRKHGMILHLRSTTGLCLKIHICQTQKHLFMKNVSLKE